MKKKSKIAFGRLDLLRNDTLNNKTKIRIGFIGGGPNSFIGYTHRLSARFDNKFEFVAGIFSKDKKKSKSFGSSLGAVSKAGNRKMVDVLDYAEQVKTKGFNFMNSPGYDPVSVTGQVASGANVICFTTGRGSCFGFKPTPSIKISNI